MVYLHERTYTAFAASLPKHLISCFLSNWMVRYNFHARLCMPSIAFSVPPRMLHGNPKQSQSFLELEHDHLSWLRVSHLALTCIGIVVSSPILPGLGSRQKNAALDNDHFSYKMHITLQICLSIVLLDRSGIRCCHYSK